MPAAPLRALRYARTWLTGRAEVRSDELSLDRAGTPVPATLVRPERARGPLPVWIVLHGITRPGRRHPQLVRFTRSVASTGQAVLVPEVPEWRALDLAPGLTVPTISAALAALPAVPGLAPDRVGLVGFSFGAPQAIAASAHPELRERLAGVVGFGGYLDLERTVVFQFTGRHEWEGRHHRLRPDPYGRWVVGANYLPSVPGLSDAAPVAVGLRRLAAEAGDAGVMAWDARFDPTKRSIRAELSPSQRSVFDLFAPPAGREPDAGPAEELAHALAAAGRRAEPGIEPASAFGDVPGPVHLLHGRHDHLIPFSEALRIGRALPPRARAGLTVTRLFGHSAQDPFPGWFRGAAESVRFARALSRLLGLL